MGGPNTTVAVAQGGSRENAKAPTSHPKTAGTPVWKALAPVAIAVVLALAPVPSGLAPYAWYFFSIFVGVIVGLILEPLPGAAVAVIGITLVTVLAPFALFSPQQLSERKCCKRPYRTLVE